MAYDPKFAQGERVCIVDRAALDEFYQTYKLHHPLQEIQLGYAGQVTEIIRSMMYHGADQLYELKDVPGIWHENLLETPKPSLRDNTD